MAGCSRIISAFLLEEPDGVPFSPFVTDSWMGSRPGVCEEMLKRTDALISIGVGGDVFLGGKAPEFVRVSRVGDDVITTVDTPRGRLRSVTRITPQMAMVKEYLLKTLDDIDRFLSVPYEPPRISPRAYSQWIERVGDQGLVLAGTPNAVMIAAENGFGPAAFNMFCLRDLSRIREFVAIGAERVAQYVESMLEAEVEAVRIVGAEYACPTFLHPRFFGELVQPFDKGLIGEIKGRPAIAYMHCHGRIREIIPMIRDMGPNALDPIERPPGGDVDLAYAKRQLGDDICLVGNLDDLNVYSMQTWEEVEPQVLDCLRMAAAGGGYALGGTASGLFTETMFENFIRTGKFVRKCGRYPFR
jgi:hypothetical protein